MEVLGVVLALAALALLAISLGAFARRRPTAEPPPGVPERREPAQVAGIADTHKAAMALVGSVALGFAAAMTMSGYVGLPQQVGAAVQRIGAVEDRQETWEQERILQRVSGLETRMDAVEETTKYQTCRSRQIDRGRDPSGCAAWLEDPERYEPSRAPVPGVE